MESIDPRVDPPRRAVARAPLDGTADAGHPTWADPAPRVTAGGQSPTQNDTSRAFKKGTPATDSAPTGAANSDQGWVRDDARMVIEYRLAGHADSIWSAWADLLASAKLVPGDAIRAARSEFLVARDANACRACHSVDATADGTLAVNWTSATRDPWHRAFIEFSHGPHLLLAELNDCQSCHRLDPERTNCETFASFDGQQIASNFVPIRRQTCIACHADPATSRCTTCHSYHIGSRKRLPMSPFAARK